MPVKTKVSRARFVVSPFNPTEMNRIGNVSKESVQERIAQGKNVSDSQAKQLTQSYARRKLRRAPPAIRNWKLTGRTLRAMQVISANENRVRIGFGDPIANQRAVINNQRERQFGLSQKNWDDIKGEIRKMHPVKAKAI